MAQNNPGSFVMPFGKFKGKTLDKISESSDGLLYLDWLIGEKPDFRELKRFLDQPSIARELDELTG